MYHRIRGLHRWAGLVASIFLLCISATGFLLATKGTFGWIRPPEKDGLPITSLRETVSLDHAGRAAFAVGIPELRDMDDVDRIDYRPKQNMFKVVSKRGYHEVQVDGKTGQVLQVARRNDQIAEDIHDLSYFANWLHDYWLPVVATLLFVLAISGICVFLSPVLRRRKFERVGRKR